MYGRIAIAQRRYYSEVESQRSWTRSVHEYYWEVRVEPREVESRWSFVPVEESCCEGSEYTIRVANGGEVGRAEELACSCTEVV